MCHGETIPNKITLCLLLQHLGLNDGNGGGGGFSTTDEGVEDSVLTRPPWALRTPPPPPPRPGVGGGGGGGDGKGEGGHGDGKGEGGRGGGEGGGGELTSGMSEGRQSEVEMGVGALFGGRSSNIKP